MSEFELRKTQSRVRKSPPQFSMPLSEPENNMLKEEAAKLGLSRPNFVRFCISEYFKNNK